MWNRPRIERNQRNERQIDLGSDRKSSNPNPREKGQRDLPWTLCHRRSPLCDRICAAAHRGVAQRRAAARPPGRRGCACAGSTAKRRQRHTQRRHTHPPASARTGEGAAMAPPPFPGRHGRSSRRCVAWREKGEGEMPLGFREGAGVARFGRARRARRAGSHRIQIRRPGATRRRTG